MKKISNKGFTLIEIILTITLLGIALAASSVIFQPAMNSWATTLSRQDATDDANYAMNRILGELAQVRNKTSVSTAASTDFQFTDINNNSVRFWVSNGNLMRNSDILARNVQNFSFQYYDLSDVLLGSPIVQPNATNVWRIRVSFGVRESDQTITLSSDVKPRNFLR